MRKKSSKARLIDHSIIQDSKQFDPSNADYAVSISKVMVILFLLYGDFVSASFVDRR